MGAVTRERPILMSGEMVRALLEGRKTMTRRLVKVCPKDGGIFVSGRPIVPEKYGAREGVIGHYPRLDGATRGRASYVVYLLDGMGLAWRPYGGSPDVPWPKERIGEVSPYGGPGDRLWVREAWRVHREHDKHNAAQILKETDGGAAWKGVIHYEADGNRPDSAGRYRHARFMPRWASRLTLEVTSVHVERLQEITEEDAKAEGVCDFPNGCCRTCNSRGRNVTYPSGCPDCAASGHDHVKKYRLLWDRINGKRAPWSSSPWVWVIAFKVITPSVPTRQPEPGEE